MKTSIHNDVSNQHDATMHRYCCRPVSPVGAQQYRCIVLKLYTQSKSAPEDGRVCRPKHVEQIQIDQ